MTASLPLNFSLLLLIAATGCQTPLMPAALGTWQSTDAGVRLSNQGDAIESRNDVDSLFDQALVLRDAGRHEDARDALTVLLQTTPDHFPATDLLAQLSRDLNDIVLQRAALQRLVQLRPDSAVVLNRAGTELLQLARIQNVSVLTSPEVEPGLTALRRAVILEPHNRDYVQSLFGALVSLEQTAEAETVLEEALRRNPRDPVLPLIAARFHEANNDWDTALTWYNAALRNEPANRVWRRQRAVCHFRMGHFELAARDFSDALEETPVTPQLSEHLMWSEACIKTDDFATAQAVLDRIVLEGNLNTADLAVLRGLCRLNQSDFSAASEITAEALVHWPTHAGLLSLAGKIERAAARSVASVW